MLCNKSRSVKRVYWIISAVRWFIIGCLHKLTGKYFISSEEYAGCRYYDYDEGQEIISEYLRSGKPFAVGRTSFVEFSFLIKNQTKRLFGIDTNSISPKSKGFISDISVNPEEHKELFGKYIDLMEESVRNVDAIAAFSNMIMCDSYLKENYDLTGKKIIINRAVEPFIGKNGWSKNLKGKKVVVVTPFGKEIKEQYLKRELIWDDPDILPEFELITVDSVWYEGDSKDERFSDWFEAFDYLYDKVMENDFDIALLGCGTFGFPLAARIKSGGKQAIHIGGALQILFGVKGKRWDESGYYNEHWIRPEVRVSKSNMKMADNGCYW